MFEDEKNNRARQPERFQLIDDSVLVAPEDQLKGLGQSIADLSAQIAIWIRNWKELADILLEGMPRYRKTELMFPKKKKRGTMRRRRRERRANE